MKYPAELTYAVIRLRGATRRYLFCRTDEKPRFGEPSFDFMGYFGFGSGEFEGEHPPEFDKIRVTATVFKPIANNPGIAKAYLSQYMSQLTDGFLGFYTTDGETFHILKEDPDGVSLTHLKALNWHYYTNIGGTRESAVSHMSALNRRHFLFKTYEEQSDLLKKYVLLAAAI